MQVQTLPLLEMMPRNNFTLYHEIQVRKLYAIRSVHHDYDQPQTATNAHNLHKTTDHQNT